MAGLNDPLTQLDYGEQFIRGPKSVTQVSGLAGLAAPSANDIARANENALADMRNFGTASFTAPRGQMPAQPAAPRAPLTKPVLAISRSTGKVWANGKLFTLDDAQGALESEQFMGGAPAPAPLAEATDWEPLDPDAYAQHIQKIKNPSLTTLATKNFGTGVDTMQMLGGYGLQFLGAEETGQGIVRQQLEDIRKNAPYQRSLEDVPERGVVEWLVANVAQQGPNLIESVVTAAIGAGAGAVAGGGANPFTAVGGAMSAMVGKQAFKQAVLAASKKYLRGEALDAAETKLLREAAGLTAAAQRTLVSDVTNAYGGKTVTDAAIRAAAGTAAAGGRQQAIAGGAALASLGQNYATGVSDLYGESVESGQPDRLGAALGAVPYAAVETLPEYLAALRFFNGFKMRALKAGGRGGRAGTIATNVGIGAGAGAALEGTTEAFQETLGIGMNADVEVDSPEGLSRLLNAFAAGAAVGGLVGAGSSLNTGKATDLLSGGTKSADQSGTTITSEPTAPAGTVAGLAVPPGGAPGYINIPPAEEGPEAEWRRLFGYTPATSMRTYPPPPRPYASPTEAQPQGELFPGATMGTAPAVVPTGPMQPALIDTAQSDLFAPSRPSPLLALPPATTIYVPPTGQQQLLSRARYAPPTERRPQGEMFTSVEMGKGKAPAQVPTGPMLPPSTDVGGMQLALQPQKEPEPPAPPTNAMTARLQQLQQRMQREAEFAAAEQQRAAPTPAAEIDYGAALADQPIVLDTEGASTGKNKLHDDGRRRIIAGFNTLDKPQQDAILAEFNNDETQLLDYVRRTSPPVVRKQFATLAKVEPEAFEVKTPKPAAPQAAAQPIVEEKPNAPKEGIIKQGRQRERAQDRKRVEGRRDNRNVPAQDQEAGGAPSGGNRLKQGKAAQAEQQGAEVTITGTKRNLKDGVTVVTLSDGRTVNIAKEAGGGSFFAGWYLDDVKGRPSEVMEKAYLGEKLEDAKARLTEMANSGRLAEVLSPKAEGAAAAPSKKAEKVSADILRDAGFTESEIRDYQSEGRYAERAAQAAKGYAYISGEWRAVTQADLDGLKAAAEQYRTETMPKLRERIKKAFADARARRPDFGPNGKLANVPYSDGPAVTEAEAYRMIETDFSVRALAKLERQYALTDEAKEAAKPKQALAVVEPKKPVEDVEAKRKAAKVAAEQAEIEALASRALSDQAEVEAMIVAYNEAEPGSVESDDALIALIEYSKDGSLGRGARTRAQDYLSYEVDEADIKVAERRMRGEEDPDLLAFNLITTTMELLNNGSITKLPQSTIGKLVSAWKQIKSKNMQYGSNPLADYIKSGPQFFNMKNGKVVPKEPGRYSISQFDNPDNPVPAGRIKLIIQKFTSKLAVKPELHVFRNQADLKARDPKLYAKMKAGRAAADFDTAVAAGYSLNDTVIIFSDRIGSEDHLAFVLAHETLGHFGFRGLMGNYDFNILMEKLYNSDPRLRAVADITMNVRGLPKAEAVEEYLSDYAGQLNTRLVLRFWKGVKTVLNRFGIKFGDEATRYLLDQSKRYVRTGQKSGVFNTSSVMQRLWAVEHGQMGRFNILDMSGDNIAASGAIHSGSPYIPRNMKDAAGKLLNFNMSWDKFKETFFSLFNYQALRNPGLYEFRRLVDETTNMEQAIFNQYNERLARVFNRSEADKSAISKVLMEGRIIATNRLLNKPMTPKDRREPLFEINPNGELVRLDANIKRFIERGILTFDELKNGTTYVREYTNEDGGTFSRKETFAGIKDLTQEQYDDYVLIRQTIAQVEMDLLEAKYKSLLHTKGTVNNAISRLLKTSKAQGAMKAVVDKATKRHRELYIAGMEADPRGLISLKPEDLMRADDFLAAVNKAIISSDAKNDPEVRAFFDDQKQADDFLADLEQFRADRKVPDNELTYLFQNQIKQLILEDVGLTKEDEMAKRTMAGGYVPFIRDNPYEVRIEAVDANGNAVRLHEDHKKLLVYSQMETIADAKGAADILATEFKDKNYTALVRQDDGSYKAQQISLRVRYGEAITKLAADPGLNLDEFMHGLRLFQINLPPDKMKKIITTLTEAGDPLRKRLEFANVPGIDKTTGIYAMAKHIQARGAIIAKTTTRPMMRDLMDFYNAESRDLWAGDPQGVIKAFNAWNSAADFEYKKHLRHELDHALFMFRQTVPGSKDWDGSRAQYDKLKGGWAQTNMNRFYNTAQKHLDFLQDNTLATESDFNVGKLAGKVRGFTTVIQLGGSIAQGVMNLASPYTNWMPYMASYNSRNGFGGGFSTGSVVAEYHRALSQVGLAGLKGGEYNTAMFYENMVNDPAALTKAGLTAEEAAFLAQEIKEGKLIPAQANALLGAARMDFTNRYALKALDLYMAPFNLSEQASRRAAALAAFRLMNRRLANAPKMSRDERIEAARDFAIQSLDFSLGEYNMMNRPPAWRDGIGSFLFMYKVFATTTIQMLARLDRKGQLAMLGTLWFLAGVEGFPFAEDLEDLIDTIAQALGLSMGSVRAEFAKTIEGIAPGLSPAILKGFVNGYIGLPADVAAKFSQGDFVPGTGALLAGASVIEEFKDIAGPMPAAVLGMAAFARDLIATPFSEATTLQGTLRGSPVTAMRMVGDSWAYLENGAIVDKRGYVVSPEMGMGTLAARLLGFYPRAAAEQYDAIRLAKRIGNYQKEMTAHYRYAWVKADLTGNAYAKRQIEREVEDWNKSAKGTGLEINDFVSNSQRAAKEARMSATQRTLRSSAKAAREDLTTLTDYIVQ